MPVLFCPKCSIPIAEIGPNDLLDAVCGSCCYRFLDLTVRVLQTTYELFHYLTIIELPPFGERRIRHWSGPLHRWAGRYVGKVGRAVVTVRGGRPDDIIWIWGADESAIKVESPGGRARGMAVSSAAVASLSVVLAGGATVLSWLGALVIGGGLFWGINKLRTPRQHLGLEHRLRLQEIQSLLGRKVELIRGRTQTEANMKKDEELLMRTASLFLKMEALDSNLYAPRIARLQSGSRLLQEQLIRERELVAEYEKAITMMDLEVEAHRVAEIWQQDMPEIDARFDRLESLRETIKRGETEILANQEIESLLESEVGSPSHSTLRRSANRDHLPPPG